MSAVHASRMWQKFASLRRDASSDFCCITCSQRYRRFVLQVLACIAVWFTAGVFIAFASKHLLSKLDFHFPFFLAFCSNSGVAIIAFIATRFPALRQPTMPSRTFLRNVVPLAFATTMDIGFSNWSLMYLAVSLHTILKGTGPLFVLICGLLIGVESLNWRTPIAIVLIVGGLTLVVFDRMKLPDRPLGVFLGLVSVSFTGLRWALTQLLMRGRNSPGSAAQPRQRTHPLSTMLYTMPVVACGAMICVLIGEREVFTVLAEYAADGRLAGLILYIFILWILVFALVFAEFQLVILTSSLTVAVFGVIKEIVTVLAAVMVGDLLSAWNVFGIVLCLAGNLIYFTRRDTTTPGSSGAGGGGDPQSPPPSSTSTTTTTTTGRTPTPRAALRARISSDETAIDMELNDAAIAGMVADSREHGNGQNIRSPASPASSQPRLKRVIVY